jgi:hypothetical protein
VRRVSVSSAYTEHWMRQRLQYSDWVCNRALQHPKIIDPTQTDEEQGFYIDEYELDKDHWTEGFVTTDGNQEYEG